MKIKLAGIIAGSLIIAACDSSTGLPQVTADVAPTISTIADRSTKANAISDPIAFSVADEQPDALSFTVMSDNADLVPVDAIAIDGNGADRTLTVTPVVDRIGDSMVSVIVTDTGGLMASASFLLTVTPETRSLQQFTRSTFASPANGDPELINAVEFTRDAEDDNFADLIAQ